MFDFFSSLFGGNTAGGAGDEGPDATDLLFSDWGQGGSAAPFVPYGELEPWDPSSPEFWQRLKGKAAAGLIPKDMAVSPQERQAAAFTEPTAPAEDPAMAPYTAPSSGPVVSPEGLQNLPATVTPAAPGAPPTASFEPPTAPVVDPALGPNVRGTMPGPWPSPLAQAAPETHVTPPRPQPPVPVGVAYAAPAASKASPQAAPQEYRGDTKGAPKAAPVSVVYAPPKPGSAAEAVAQAQALNINHVVQKQRPAHFQGTLSMNGKTYRYGTGSRNAWNQDMHRGSIPYGTFNIERFTSGAARASEGRSYRKDSFEVAEMADPKWNGVMRRGILLHESRDLNKLYSAGCIAVAKDQWPAFKADLQAYMKANNGKLVLRVNPDGSASIAPRTKQDKPYSVASALR